MRPGSQRATRCAVAAAFGALLAACGRDAARNTARNTANSVAARSDTVVRRVVRVRREPSALQRVTQAIDVRRALVSLDSPLVVRVLDRRGGDLPGARVQWSIARGGEGARLLALNDVTDSASLSRAAFTPGRTADPQIVVAEVAGVGRIAFEITVPVVRLQLAPPGATLWSGDAVVVNANLFDAGGTALDGGAISWNVSDTSVVRAVGLDSTHARLTGRLAGSAEVVAWLGQLRGDARVTVYPVTAGAIETLDGEPLPRLSLIVSAGAWRDTAAVVGGAFSVRVPPREDTDVRFRVSPAGGRYHDADVRVLSPRDLHVVNIALVPVRWRIDAGAYRGTVIPIDANAAMQPVAGRAPFWRLAPISGHGPKTLLGWRASDLPLRIAFDRATSPAISAADSAAFWNAARRMEADIGSTFFEPATLAGESRGIVPVEIRAQASQGHTFVSWAQTGDANDATLLFRDVATLRDPHVVTHELLHLLGFGHAVAWPSIARPAGGSETRLTADDVAYVQVALRLRERQARTGARPGLPAPGQ